MEFNNTNTLQVNRTLRHRTKESQCAPEQNISGVWGHIEGQEQEEANYPLK